MNVPGRVGPTALGPSAVVFGRTVSTRTRCTVASETLPAASALTTLISWLPCPGAIEVLQASSSPTYWLRTACPFRRTSSVVRASARPLTVKPLVASSAPSDGDVTTGAVGLTLSTVNSTSTGVGSTCPARSVARTRNVYAPSARPSYVTGAVHPLHAPLRPGPMSAHSSVPGSVPVNPKVAVRPRIAVAGPEVNVVSGTVVSIRKVRVAGVASRLPARSTARMLNVYSPSFRVQVVGDGQVDHPLGGATMPGPSSRHSIVAGSDAENANVALGVVIGPLGPLVKVVSGAVRSRTIQRSIPLSVAT